MRYCVDDKSLKITFITWLKKANVPASFVALSQAFKFPVNDLFMSSVPRVFHSLSASYIVYMYIPIHIHTYI